MNMETITRPHQHQQQQCFILQNDPCSDSEQDHNYDDQQVLRLHQEQQCSQQKNRVGYRRQRQGQRQRQRQHHAEQKSIPILLLFVFVCSIFVIQVQQHSFQPQPLELSSRSVFGCLAFQVYSKSPTSTRRQQHRWLPFITSQQQQQQQQLSSRNVKLSLSLSSSSSLESSSSSGNEAVTVATEQENQIEITSSNSNSTTTTTTSMKNGISTILITFNEYFHRPLGCTIEESLALSIINSTITTLPTTSTTTSTKNTKKKDIFVSKVVSGSYAEQAGIQVGDIIIGISNNMFDSIDYEFNDTDLAKATTTTDLQLQSTIGCSIDTIKNLISSCPDYTILQIQVIRGTDVLQQHENILLQVITNPNYEQDEIQTELTLTNYIKGGYDYSTSPTTVQVSTDTDTDSNTNDDVNDTDNNNDDSTDDDNEIDIDTMYNIWANLEDYSGNAVAQQQEQPNNSNSSDSAAILSTSSQTKPWSSRSSPSGTWVRDPRTGVIRDIDNQT